MHGKLPVTPTLFLAACLSLTVQTAAAQRKPTTDKRAEAVKPPAPAPAPVAQKPAVAKPAPKPTATPPPPPAPGPKPAAPAAEKAPAEAPAGNDAMEQAKQHYMNGLAMVGSQNFEGAATEFEASVKLYPTKEGLFNLANCYKSNGKYADALSVIQRLKIQFKDQIDEKWQTEISNFETEMAGLVAHLAVSVNVEGATIEVDGKPMGESPMMTPIIMAPGRHQIVVSKEGYSSDKRAVVLAVGDKAAESFELAASPAWVSIESSVEGAAVYIDGNPVGLAPIERYQVTAGPHAIQLVHPSQDHLSQNVNVPAGETVAVKLTMTPLIAAKPAVVSARSCKRRVWTPIVLGVAGAAGVGALLTGMLNLEKAHRLEDECDAFKCPTNLAGEGDKAKKLGVAANVLVSVAAVGAVVGTILFFTEGREKKPAATKVSIAPHATSSGGGLSISGRF